PLRVVKLHPIPTEKLDLSPATARIEFIKRQVTG
ncbi:MAG: hypothetical protein ACI82G_001704, partial [Bradymonadia bacterium]